MLKNENKRKMALIGIAGLVVTVVISISFIFFSKKKSAMIADTENSFTTADTATMRFKDMIAINNDKNLLDTTQHSKFIQSINTTTSDIKNRDTIQKNGEGVIESISGSTKKQLAQIEKIRSLTSSTKENSNFQSTDQQETQLNSNLQLQLSRIEQIKNQSEKTKQIKTDPYQNEEDEISKYLSQRKQSIYKEESNGKNENTTTANTRGTWIGFNNVESKLKNVSKKIAAVVLNEVTVQVGSTIDVLLKSSYESGGKIVPANTTLFADVTSIDNNRLKAKIYAGQSNPDLEGIIFSVYDSDGQEGIRINNALRANSGQLADEAKSEASSALTSAATVATSRIPFAGSAVRMLGLVGRGNRKTSYVKATMPAGYKILLKPMLVNEK
jgi:hypothetical protein